MIGVVAALALGRSTAHADGPSPNEAAADALFVEAKSLMVAGEDASACPKLAQSQDLDPGTGTLLLLALCHERVGRTASAWEEYRDALGRAEHEHRGDRAEVARRHIALLEPRLVRVRVRVADEDASIPGFAVRRDGEPMAPSAWLVPIPLDPGAHTLEAFAGRERLWSTTFTTGTEPVEEDVLVPKLHLPASPTPPPPPTAQSFVVPRSGEREPSRGSPPPHASPGLRIGAYGAAVIGIAGVVVGAIYGVYAINDRHEAERLCPAYPCAAGAAEANDAAKSAAILSDIAFAAAGAGALGAFTLVLLDRRGGAANALGPAPSGGLLVGWRGHF